MKRWLFNIAAGFSLLVGILVIIVWIRSEFVLDYLRYLSQGSPTEYSRLNIGTLPGAIRIQYERLSFTPNGTGGGLTVDERLRAPRMTGTGYGSIARTQWPMPEQFWFAWEKEESTASPFETTALDRVQIPDWFLLLLSSVLPTIWLIKFRRRHKLPGCCLKCGYDLRATPDRCPECGTVPALPS